MSVEVGNAFRAGFKKQTGPWGETGALLLGAGDCFEFNSESMKPGTSTVKNEGISGNAYRRPGSPGPILPEGDLDIDLYYRCASLRMLAHAHGADAVTNLGGGAYRHDMSLTKRHDGLHGTLALLGDAGVREHPFAKVVGVKLAWDESRKRAKMTPSIAAFDENFHIGTPDDDFVVAQTAAANGALTITAAALADFPFSPLSITKDAGVTALTAAIVAVDKRGGSYTKTITQADFVSNVWTDTVYVRRVVSITLSGVTGTGNLKVGVTNGVNNVGTASGLTTVADRDEVLFEQIEVWVAPQTKATDFDSGDEQFVSKLEVGIAHNVDKRVTTKFGYRMDEPTTGGGGWPEVMFNMSFSAFTDRNRQRLLDIYAANKLRAKVVCTGPPVGASGQAHKLELYLNAIQIEGGLSVGGPGVVAFDLTGSANVALAVPFGFPAGHVMPLLTRVTNAEANPYV